MKKTRLVSTLLSILWIGTATSAWAEVTYTQNAENGSLSTNKATALDKGETSGSSTYQTIIQKNSTGVENILNVYNSFGAAARGGTFTPSSSGTSVVVTDSSRSESFTSSPPTCTCGISASHFNVSYGGFSGYYGNGTATAVWGFSTPPTAATGTSGVTGDLSCRSGAILYIQAASYSGATQLGASTKIWACSGWTVGLACGTPCSCSCS
jgi:hypothetical protein